MLHRLILALAATCLLSGCCEIFGICTSVNVHTSIDPAYRLAQSRHSRSAQPTVVPVAVAGLDGSTDLLP